MYGRVQLSHRQRGMLQEVPNLLHAHRHRIHTKSLKANLIFVDDTRASVGLLHRVRDHLPRARTTTVLLVVRLAGALWWRVDELLPNHRMRASEEILQLVLRHRDLFGIMARNLRWRGNTCCQWGATGRSGLRNHPQETLAARREANIEHVPSPFVHAGKTQSELDILQRPRGGEALRRQPSSGTHISFLRSRTLRSKSGMPRKA